MATAAQRASPPRTTEPLYTEFDPEVSSAAGPCALSGAELTGGLLLDGNMSGAFDGVAAAVGTSASGELAGVTGLGGGVAWDGLGEGTLIDRVGETAFCGGDAAGACEGVADGLAFGALTGTAGETFEGGEGTGDFAGAEWGLEGVDTGECVAGGGAWVGALIGAGEGAWAVCASPEYCAHNSRKATANNLLIF